MSLLVARPVPFARAPEPPRRLVLLGHPVHQSRSPIFQNAALATIGSPLRYDAVDVVPTALASVVRALAAEGGAGNVTVPHKEAMLPLCASLTPVAQQVGAVNCFWTGPNGLVGDNTDVAGVRESIEQLIGAPSTATFGVRLLGAGGSAAAVLAALDGWPRARVSLWARSPDRAVALRDRLRPSATLVDDATDALADVRLIINTTPLGIAGELPPVPVETLHPSTAVLDLVYALDETPWVRAARARRLRALDGLRMLIEQGALSFARWFGRPPDRRVLWRALGVLPPTPSGRRIG